MNLFNDWRMGRNRRCGPSDMVLVPAYELVDFSVDLLNRWIPLFLLEVQKCNGAKVVKVDNGVRLDGV
jgi:hypothetical protein